MAKKKTASESPLGRISANIDTLIENDKLVLSQFEKLYDEFEILRNDVHDVKDKNNSMSLRLFTMETDIKTIKRLAQEEPEKRHALEHRIRQVIPHLPK